ncbi:hypothetical protein LNP04_03535 [Chryseobacterium sp. C-71]|uniref:hypothetical protein n=1 Tax=Chryseobacterium sp. C-71 TaxID=2893882 RepID=UPI001E3DDE2D|nr:hypothetical protein [Chryseobacterium sp. C-71]UFH32804.1 hypothetical protein LNP04_03535 [Chryseobacterium sp. C-71]
MNIAQQKEVEYIESIDSNFVGRKIQKVFYEEINYEIDSEFWEHSQNIHSIDMNVIFLLDNGKLLQIKWDNEFRCYGIGFEELSEIKIREGLKLLMLQKIKIGLIKSIEKSFQLKFIGKRSKARNIAYF